jgi:DNA topoisomerase-1
MPQERLSSTTRRARFRGARGAARLATGVDHPGPADKFAHLADFALALPLIRSQVRTGLGRVPGADAVAGHEHVLALTVRLLDRGFFRVGSERYTRDDRRTVPHLGGHGARRGRTRRGPA